MEKKTKYYDITHFNAKDEWVFAEIKQYEDGTFYCDEFDYVITKEMLFEGLESGWATTEQPKYWDITKYNEENNWFFSEIIKNEDNTYSNVDFEYTITQDELIEMLFRDFATTEEPTEKPVE